jgi:hypothetical protein
MRVRNATALALAETAVACHSGTSVDTAVHAPPAPKGCASVGADGFCWQIDRLEVAYVRWRISGQGLPLSVPQLFCASTNRSAARLAVPMGSRSRAARLLDEVERARTARGFKGSGRETALFGPLRPFGTLETTCSCALENPREKDEHGPPRSPAHLVWNGSKIISRADKWHALCYERPTKLEPKNTKIPEEGSVSAE